MVINLSKSKNTYKPLITRAVILHYFTSLQLFHFYIPGLQLGKPFISPLRPKEKNPSFSIFQTNNDLEGTYMYKDHGGKGNSGDIFKLVGLLYNLTFTEVLSKMCIELGLSNKYNCILQKDAIIRKINKKNIESIKKIVSKTRKKIELYISKREWKPYDIRYWKNYGIKLNILNKYNVVPIKSYQINNNLYSVDKLAYAFIENKDNRETYKIYQPFNIANVKWRSSNNSSIWHGWEQLPAVGDILIITKSLKDVMAITSNTEYSAVSLQSEITIPKNNVMDELNHRFLNIYILYDNDFNKKENVGQQQATKLINKFKERVSNLTNIIIDRKYNSKDFSDFVQIHGAIYASNVLKSKIERNKMPF